MFTEHPTFKKPDNEKSVIWRFMDFTKFASLLEKNALYFCRADLLGDPFEGTFSKATIQKLIESAGKDKEKLEIISKQLIESPKSWSHVNFLNCWHVNEHEPYSMWNSYAKGNQGIAIQSTYESFKKSFASTSFSKTRVSACHCVRARSPLD